MKRLTIILGLVACLTLFSKAYAEEAHSISAEQQAYEEMLSYLVKITFQTGGDDSSVWTKGLETLINSPSEEGDKYLTNLSFFGLDAHPSEEFSCAIDRRLFKHGETFVKHLESAPERFDKENPCQTFNAKQGKSYKVLHCESKESFNRSMMWWVSEYENPNPNPEVDCSEYFE